MDAESEVFDTFRRTAYEEADILTVRLIRDWVESGCPDPS